LPTCQISIIPSEFASDKKPRTVVGAYGGARDDNLDTETLVINSHTGNNYYAEPNNSQRTGPTIPISRY